MRKSHHDPRSVSKTVPLLKNYLERQSWQTNLICAGDSKALAGRCHNLREVAADLRVFEEGTAVERGLQEVIMEMNQNQLKQTPFE
jgi:predicted transcriptional regulator